MMKIVLFFPNDSEGLFNKNCKRTFGGSSVNMFFLAKKLREYKDIQVYSFIPEYDTIDFDDRDEFNLILTYKEKDSFLKKIYKIHKKLSLIKPDFIIQMGFSFYSTLFSKYCKIFDYKYIFQLAHDIESEGKYQNSGKKCLTFGVLLKNSHKIIAQNQIEYDLLLKNNSINKEKLTVIRKGIDYDKFRFEKVKQYSAIWVGRCERWKHPEIFLKLAEINPFEKFVFVCTKVPGKEKYFEQIKQYAISLENIIFFDFLPNREIINLVSLSKIFVITSEKEGDWPITVLEALANRVPIISLQLDYNSLLRKNKAGYFCNNNFELLHIKFNKLLYNSEVYSFFSENAFKYIKEYHDLNINVDKLVFLLKNC